MNKKLYILLTALLCLTATGCRSHKQQSAASVATEEVQEAKWTNVYLPVKVQMLEPQQVSFSGRATLVRGASIYISIRLLGMEMGSMYATPSEGWVTIKPQRTAVRMSLTDMLQLADVDFATVQDAMLGDEAALDRLPARVKASVQQGNGTSTVTLSATYREKPVKISLTWDFNSAQWDIPSPQQWTAPGSNYKIIEPNDVGKLLEGL